jgi:hypothetical protein
MLLLLCLIICCMASRLVLRFAISSSPNPYAHNMYTGHQLYQRTLALLHAWLIGAAAAVLTLIAVDNHDDGGGAVCDTPPNLRCLALKSASASVRSAGVKSGHAFSLTYSSEYAAW